MSDRNQSATFVKAEITSVAEQAVAVVAGFVGFVTGQPDVAASAVAHYTAAAALTQDGDDESSDGEQSQ